MPDGSIVTIDAPSAAGSEWHTGNGGNATACLVPLLNAEPVPSLADKFR